MRSVRRFAIALAVLSALGGPRAEAQEAAARPRGLGFEMGVFGGLFLADEHHEFYDPSTGEQQPLGDASPDLGVRLGFYPLSFLGLEGEAGAALGDIDGDSANLYSVRAALVLQAPLRVAPFILGGIGNTWLRSEPDVLGTDRDRVWHAAAGLKIFATSSVQLRIEGRLYYSNQERPTADPTDDNGMVAHFGALAGITWALGGRSRPETELEPDPDGDGFVVPEDLCPNEKGLEPDGCPAKDTDRDGLNDSADPCPTEAEVMNGVDDTDGCPDEMPDPDGDGLRGEDDRCLDQAEDKDGFRDDDGCPEADNDEDGLVDASDLCPDQAGAPENRGCPDTDKDQDGVVDRLDNCPDEPGRAEFEGCRTRQLISITPSQLKVFQNVQFSSSKATIASRSRRLLVNVAQVIRSHPEFQKIRVEGHTDDRGADELNKALSQARAQSVVDFLIGRGVEPERLEAVGMGEAVPLSSNRTATGRRRNRRVEFHLQDIRPPRGPQAAPAPASPAPTEGAKSAPAAEPKQAPADPKTPAETSTETKRAPAADPKTPAEPRRAPAADTKTPADTKRTPGGS